MTTFSIDSLINSSIDVIKTVLNNTTTLFNNYFTVIATPETTKSYHGGALSIYKNLTHFFYFDEFQLKLLKAFLIILFINIVFIYVLWRIYGKRICEQFMKPATYKAIEELKASVSRLKLPKEHTPRI